MPEETMNAAVCSTRASETLQPNAFQSFHPIGGVRARPLFSAAAGAAVDTATVTGAAAVRTSASSARRMALTGSCLPRGSGEAGPLIAGRRGADRGDGEVVELLGLVAADAEPDLSGRVAGVGRAAGRRAVDPRCDRRVLERQRQR